MQRNLKNNENPFPEYCMKLDGVMCYLTFSSEHQTHNRIRFRISTVTHIVFKTNYANSGFNN